MLDLDTIATETLIARGQYSTVRAAHEDAKQQLATLRGQLTSIQMQVLRRAQEDRVPDEVADLLTTSRSMVEQIADCVARIESLASQRAELKQLAWGKGTPE